MAATFRRSGRQELALSHTLEGTMRYYFPFPSPISHFMLHFYFKFPRISYQAQILLMMEVKTSLQIWKEKEREKSRNRNRNKNKNKDSTQILVEKNSWRTVKWIRRRRTKRCTLMRTTISWEVISLMTVLLMNRGLLPTILGLQEIPQRFSFKKGKKFNPSLKNQIQPWKLHSGFGSWPSYIKFPLRSPMNSFKIWKNCPFSRIETSTTLTKLSKREQCPLDTRKHCNLAWRSFINQFHIHSWQNW